MKKNGFIYPTIFLVLVIALILFIIPIGAFLTAEVAKCKTVKSVGECIYVFLKDQGSLIAGILGIIGVVFLVINQNKSTEKTVGATLEAVRSELSEAKNRACDEYALDIIEAIDAIDLIVVDGVPETYANSSKFVDEALKKSKRLRVLVRGGTFEVESMIIESCLVFYKKLLRLYGEGFPERNKKNISTDLRDEAKSIRSFLERNKHSRRSHLLSDVWCPSAIRELSKEVFISDGEVEAYGDNICKVSHSDVKRFYYLLSGIKIQLGSMVSSRYSNDEIN